ncbi:aromatic-ring-hydroxylating dioxygenase subunit beta [Melittangium boletus]|uniref:Benzene 1,2-dioxygenase n=1 Tax=Melittangium boletus DSM 14713 TaxID=1294270 RepID=A0A250IC72_9BACT|nr:aromatic-ring-hydroxylating dioxygenase subunit beta [Melittangium boletus]ATB28737.1 benzene 1,2-dioxygenase [Melittangium boletus DSM 14713]
MSAELSAPTPFVPSFVPGPALQYALEQFLFTEAALLDEHRYEEWLKLFTPDARYRMPARTNHAALESERRELLDPDAPAHFDDDFRGLSLRVGRLMSGLAWSESPLSRTRRLVSNVRSRALPEPGALEVFSSFLLYRSSQEHDVDVFAGMRRDVLRRGDMPGSWRIAHRTVLLDQTVILASNLSVFF